MNVGANPAIKSVKSGSAADAAGLKVGDIITSINGVDVQNKGMGAAVKVLKEVKGEFKIFVHRNEGTAARVAANASQPKTAVEVMQEAKQSDSADNQGSKSVLATKTAPVPKAASSTAESTAVPPSIPSSAPKTRKIVKPLHMVHKTKPPPGVVSTDAVNTLPNQESDVSANATVIESTPVNPSLPAATLNESVSITTDAAPSLSAEDRGLKSVATVTSSEKHKSTKAEEEAKRRAEWWEAEKARRAAAEASTGSASSEASVPETESMQRKSIPSGQQSTQSEQSATQRPGGPVKVSNAAAKLAEKLASMKARKEAGQAPVQKQLIRTRVCAHCGKAILGGEYLEACGKEFHKECFVCHKCKRPLSGGFTMEDGNVTCMACVEAAADRCHRCRKSTLSQNPEDMMKVVYVEDYAFHPTCYTCRSCSCDLSSKAVFVVNEEIYCKTHAECPVAGPPKGKTAFDRLAASLGTDGDYDKTELDERGLKIVR